MRCGEADGWEVRADRQGGQHCFRVLQIHYRRADFYFTASMTGDSIDSLTDEIEAYYENFDPDYEASLWIGPDGHGQRGAPYHIKDIIADMEEAEEMVYELLKAIRKIA